MLLGEARLLSGPPRGGVGAGMPGLPEDWAWGAPERGESASPRGSGAAAEAGNNNTGARGARRDAARGEGGGGGRGGGPTRATYFLEGG